ncbi:G/U mismatch-specific DNA glycosylase [Embleya sp. NPDC050493]|uniref:G/U mismatch-specific DNA glycosylase n=1 Tax=Embleya sp. NPDC050493 TaxID=3363989 RepID=UPI0037AB3C6A
MPPGRNPTAAELAAAHGRSIPDVIGPDLRVLFCGINPGLWSGATGRHFARPGNRFWPALYASGFTPRLLAPTEQDELLALGLGITNVVARTTARADELTKDEYIAGGAALTARVHRYRPAWLAVLGIGAYRTGFGRPKAVVGRQHETIGDTGIWVLPNPSGLNAHWTAAALAEAFAELRAASSSRADEAAEGHAAPEAPAGPEGRGAAPPA